VIKAAGISVCETLLVYKNVVACLCFITLSYRLGYIFVTMQCECLLIIALTFFSKLSKVQVVQMETETRRTAKSTAIHLTYCVLE
jgi:hypothetical protein